MTYNPNVDLVFGIFLILVPFIVMGALGIAAVIYSNKEGTPAIPVKQSEQFPSESTSTQETTSPPAPAEAIPTPVDILALAGQLEEHLRKRVNGTTDLQVSNGSHDLKLAQELNTWAEWERGLQKSRQEHEPS